MRKPHFSVFLLIALMSCSSGKDEVVTPEVGPRLDPEYLAMTQMGGAASLGGSTSPGSLSAPAPNLEPATLEQHLIGDANFEMAFIPGPDTQHPLHVGLGPVFNNSSCLNCHSRDGRGVLPPLTQGESRVKLIANAALLIRLSVEGDLPRPKDEQNGWGAPLSVPGFSGQLFHRGIFTLRPDSPGTGQADIYLRFESTSFSYPDGRTLTLRKPIFDIENAYDGAQSRLYASDVRTSPRIAPAMVGLGLLEAIPEEQILARADIEDADGDGISGRPNWVLDLQKQAAHEIVPLSLGRFGYKCSAPTLRQQTAAALNGDMGVTSSLLPNQSIDGTPLFETYKKNLGPDFALLPKIEASDDLVDALALYSRTLGVPSRRNVDDTRVQKGGRLFQTLQCASCHAGSYVIGDNSLVAEYRGLRVHPFTDLLLHDMGEGLADNRRDFDADGREWRTSPLWGVGVAQLVNPRAGFLHDGRARSLEEAILWHGGEALRAKESFTKLPPDDRDAVLAFLGSL